MPSMAGTPTTAESLLELCDPSHRFELVRGELRRMSPASSPHGLVAMRIGARLDEHVRCTALGAVFAADTGFLLERNPDTVRAPDVAFVRIDRIPDPPPPGWFPGAPDLAVEVVSPTDRYADVESKARQWLAAGATAVWIANPVTRTLVVLRAAEARVLGPDDELAADDLLPGFAVRVRDLFPDLSARR